ncbi:3'-5' exoribonuclease [Paraburkholderia mimosarum]|uniref:3'-5' exoribonuclease n=1 Tax=Paraburkholderia mimosarum TaxID=312026 RepID=UPI0012B5DA6C|nr:3'-5' exoribonuclease [Paraburkholderia mimosarum]
MPPEKPRRDLTKVKMMTTTTHGRPAPRSPWKTRYFLDTEFTDFDTSELISVAIVGEDGREFYGERSDFERKHCSDFVCEVVLPQLGRFPGRSMQLTQLRKELLAWLLLVPEKPVPVLCYDFAGDFELVIDLMGGALPRGWKHENVVQKLDVMRRLEYIAAHGGQHHALHDARANAYAFR